MNGSGAYPVTPGVPTAPVEPVLPRIAPARPSPVPSRASGVTDLDTLTPAESLQSGNRSWATVLGIAVVAEALLFWLAGWLFVARREGLGARSARRTGPRSGPASGYGTRRAGRRH